VEGWAGETTAGCDIRWFDGDHFFIMLQERAVLECISGVINQLRDEPSGDLSDELKAGCSS
jgi:surfactin synthase thioesterase subunit